ncbi:MAG: sensor histidine kinase, partial [Clostridia bacterium]|nr:sensor histidine kinase [Clostridia bacterium]
METFDLDKILQDTIDVLEKSKEQIFDIAEHARAECVRLDKEIKQIRELTLRVIEEVDACELKVKSARVRLMKVNRDVDKYSEEDMRKAYEEVSALQVKVALLRERENQLKAKRHELELSHL